MSSTPTSRSASAPPADWRPSNRLRFVTATSLFDGHDASINIMRRLLQAQGAEVIHLGHDRGVAEVVDAAIEEDAHAIAVSSYQGGHDEYFGYMVDLLGERGRGDIVVFGGGGGTITDREIAALEARGVARIYSVEDGRRLGLTGMICDMMMRADRCLHAGLERVPDGAFERSPGALARLITWLEALGAAAGSGSSTAAATLSEVREVIAANTAAVPAPVLGVTGTGGAGKSSLTDELVRRYLDAYPGRTLSVLSVDPSRRRSGGALLGDRIRMNSVADGRVFMRSLATRRANASVSESVGDVLAAMRAAHFDLVILETAGIGQGGTEVVDLSDVCLYVMTPEFGAPSQLEKIDMLDFADLVAINKSDKRGADDALRHVAKQVARNRGDVDGSSAETPVYLCSASHFGDPGVDRVFSGVLDRLDALRPGRWPRAQLSGGRSGAAATVIPPGRARYLAEIAGVVRSYHARGEAAAAVARRADGLHRALAALGVAVPGVGSAPRAAAGSESASGDASVARVYSAYVSAISELDSEARDLLADSDDLRAAYMADENVYRVRGREIRVRNYKETLSGIRVPKVAVPRTDDWATLLRWRWRENVPGRFPFTSGVFPYKRSGEDPTRMFAGEGTPERTNLRFHYLAAGQPAARLSTAFDSVTLYGRDPGERPDIYGKIGNSGVSVATIDDTKRLYSGFDICSPRTSVSMTINGPAPIVLAMFFNTAIDQAAERRLRETGRWDSALAHVAELLDEPPQYRAPGLPPGNDGFGLGLLGASAADVLAPDEYAEVRAAALENIRGTVQADILKEDQAQNTCIFSIDFALRMQGDIQQFFIDNSVRNFYSVSISGYHIAEAGASPISQLAFTLANGFTFAEYFRSRGMEVDAFARNLSFFFSNGIDPEYSVIGRVARRIWAIAMRDLYGADERSQKLKYHIQTSGRSLHAQEIDFNDIRTTLQAFYAIADNCNSLHTNAFDEAITTPTEASVRRALAIQLILNREFGLLDNENPLQGSYFIEELTDLVEEAVLAEFESISERGGVLGAMELMYQRSKIQEESLCYEQKKHSGEIPIVGVNTFARQGPDQGVVELELVRSSDADKLKQIEGVRAFQQRNADRSDAAIKRLQETALSGENIFAELMETVRSCSLGQITDALFQVGGQYRRSM